MTTTAYITSKAGVNLAKPDAIAQGPIGELAFGSSGSVFEYIRYNDATAGAAGLVVAIDKDGVALLCTNTDALAGMRIGVLRSAPAQGQFVWAQVRGQALVSTAAAAAANVLLRTTTTEGKVDDATSATNTKQLMGMYLAAAAGSATDAECFLNFPYVGATDA